MLTISTKACILISEVKERVRKMKIKKDSVKTVKETANVVNSYSKLYRNPKNSFPYLISNDDYLVGDFQKIGNKKYICNTGNMSYLVTVQ